MIWATASTEEKVAAITEFSGFSASQMAENWGTTRNAVLGFRRRQGLSMPASTVRKRRRAAAARKVRRATAIIAKTGNADAAAQAIGKSKAHILQLLRAAKVPFNEKRIRVKFPVYPLPPPKTWLPLPDVVPAAAGAGCQWPIEVDGVPQGSCGGHVHKRSYCERHFRVAYRTE